jgi:integrase
MGDLRLEQITPRLVSDLTVKKFAEHLRSQKVKNLKHCLSSIMQHAHMPDGYIERDPVRGVKVPKPENEQASREPDPFPWEDRTTLEKAYRENFPRYFPLILTGFRTALRLGELMTLQWCDIDFKHPLIGVTRNLSVGRITTPKSRSSVRDVRMITQLLHELQALRTIRKAETLKKKWSEVPEWVFCNKRGHVLNPDNFRKLIWDRAM